MESYKSRSIKFKETISIKEWKIKIYTISKSQDFDHPQFYEQVKNEIPKWLAMHNSFNAKNDKIAFLILHSGNEGIFSIINWWIDQHMMNSHIFLSEHENLNEFNLISGDGLAPCIWELEVINHERNSWIKHVLKQSADPNFEAYLNDTITLEL